MPAAVTTIVPETAIAAAREAAAAAIPPALASLVDDYRRIVAALHPPSHYQSFDDDARRLQAALLDRGGPTGFAAAHALLMVEAIEAFDARQPADGYPPSILDRFRFSDARILAKIGAADWSGYDRPGDLLWKDLGIATQRLMPGGARTVEPEAWLPKSILWRGGVGQAVRAARLFLTHGTGPYLNLHTHDYELGDFSASGWRDLMLRLAELLRRRPHLKGMFIGGGWMYDPNLRNVSPRLAYHLDLPVANGGETFFYAVDGPDSLAFFKSETRRRLHAEGQYQPELHILVWRREALIAWADAQPS